mgnify:CR=1 FL=1
MQTFLPLPDLRASAQALDYKRLGKQRVEAKQIHDIVSGKRTSGGWVNHPAVTMWRDYPDALAMYHNAVIAEWVARGYKNNMPYLPIPNGEIIMPRWFDNDAFHSAHRRMLLYKNPTFYSEYGWPETNDGIKGEYIWPETA